MRASDVRGSVRRVRLAGVVLLVAFATLAVRAAHLAIVDGRGAQRGLAQTQRVLALAPERGAIVDGSGAELALSVDAPSVYAVASEIADPDGTARALARALGMDADRIAERLRAHAGFLFLARWVSAKQAQRVAELELPGVGLIDEPRRVYPYGPLAAPVLGFANIDGVGVRGIEQLEEAWLRGTPSRLKVERDARGRLLMGAGAEPWTTAGGDVKLTIDAALQAVAEAALADAVARTGARGGVVIALEPASGAILALAEMPGFDPNHFRDLDYEATRSRAFLDATEPGSTLKAFLVAAALENESLRLDAAIDCENGSFRVPGKTIHDTHPHGVLTPADVLRVSSNIGAIKIAYALGPRPYHALLHRFGFGDVTSRFPDESAGMLRSWEAWRPLDHAAIAFGQGISVTPIQLAAATATLANGGTWVPPRLVAARREARGGWRSASPGVERQVIRPETAGAVLEMLEGVVSPAGTGRLAILRGVRVAGKTGTAQKFDAKQGRYDPNRFTAWFIGIAPAEAPRLAIVAGLDEPRRPTHTGGAAAAPLFARVAAAQLGRLGIMTEPVAEPVAVAAAPGETRAAQKRVTPPAPAPPGRKAAPATPPAATSRAPELVRVVDRLLLPDFSGLTLDEVRKITARGGLDVELLGNGRAVAQDPPPGTVVALRAGRVRIRFAKVEDES